MILVEKKLVFKANEFNSEEINEVLTHQASEGWKHSYTHITDNQVDEDDHPMEIELRFIHYN